MAGIWNAGNCRENAQKAHRLDLYAAEGGRRRAVRELSPFSLCNMSKSGRLGAFHDGIIPHMNGKANKNHFLRAEAQGAQSGKWTFHSQVVCHKPLATLRKRVEGKNPPKWKKKSCLSPRSASARGCVSCLRWNGLRHKKTRIGLESVDRKRPRWQGDDHNHEHCHNAAGGEPGGAKAGSEAGEMERKADAVGSIK